MKKGLGYISVLVYGIIIIGIHVIAEYNLDFAMLFYFPYLLGGNGIIGFFAGRIVQKGSKAKNVFGCLGYMVLISVFAFFACLFTASHGFAHSLGSVFRLDTYMILYPTAIGFLIGEIYQKRKMTKKLDDDIVE